MEVSLRRRPDPARCLAALDVVLAEIGPRIVACSGGIDSLLLATVAHRSAPELTEVAHTVTAAVPPEATERVTSSAVAEGWKLNLLASGEFGDENYLSNPVNRCYHCKSNLYDAIVSTIAPAARERPGAPTVLSGANIDDLGEYRPGLEAAAEHGVRHPYIEADIAKADIRAMAHHLGLDIAELASSPCLASRLYTGTRVTPERLAAVHAGERIVTELTGVDVVRCRIENQIVRVEVADADRHTITPAVLAQISAAMGAHEPGLTVTLDSDAYRPGRAFAEEGR